jgi:hypothetical protein
VAILNRHKKEAEKKLNRAISGGFKPPQNIRGKSFFQREKFAAVSRTPQILGTIFFEI